MPPEARPVLPRCYPGPMTRQGRNVSDDDSYERTRNRASGLKLLRLARTLDVYFSRDFETLAPVMALVARARHS